LIQHIQKLEIVIYRLGAFDMKDRRQRIVLHALPDLIDRAAHANAPSRLPFNTEEKRHHAEDSPLRRRQFDGGRQRGFAARVLRRRVTLGAGSPVTRRDEDREQPSGESSLKRFGKIQVALVLAFVERRGCVRAAAPVKTQQSVIVTIKDRDRRRERH